MANVSLVEYLILLATTFVLLTVSHDDVDAK